MKWSIELVGGTLQAFEFVVFVCAAMLLVAVGPVLWFHRLYTTDSFVSAGFVAVCWLASGTAVAREVYRKAVTVVSFGVFLGWLVVLAWVFHDWFS